MYEVVQKENDQTNNRRLLYTVAQNMRPRCVTAYILKKPRMTRMISGKYEY